MIDRSWNSLTWSYDAMKNMHERILFFFTLKSLSFLSWATGQPSTLWPRIPAFLLPPAACLHILWHFTSLCPRAYAVSKPGLPKNLGGKGRKLTIWPREPRLFIVGWILYCWLAGGRGARCPQGKGKTCQSHMCYCYPVPFRGRGQGRHSFWVKKKSLGYVRIGGGIRRTPAPTEFHNPAMPFLSFITELRSWEWWISAKPCFGDQGPGSDWAWGERKGHSNNPRWQFLTRITCVTIRHKENWKWNPAIKWEQLSYVRDKAACLEQLQLYDVEGLADKTLICEGVRSFLRCHCSSCELRGTKKLKVCDLILLSFPW